MIPMAYSPAVVEQKGQDQTTAGWSMVSWVFFALAILSSAAFGYFWLSDNPRPDHPLAALSIDLARWMVILVAYWAAWLCALAGAASGVIGVSKPWHRTTPAWAAVALNGACWLALVLVMIL
jgi:hypothetical protein